MKEVKLLSLFLEFGCTMSFIGNREKIKSYLEKGYIVKKNLFNIYWILEKTDKLKVIIDNDSKFQEIDITDEVCNYYNAQTISDELYEIFFEDEKAQKLKFYLKDDQLIIQ